MLDFLNRLFGSGPSSPSIDDVINKYAPAAPASYPNNPALPSVNSDWLKNYVSAARSTANAHPTSLFNLLTGNQGDAAAQTAQAVAPIDFYKNLSAPVAYTAADTAAKQGQLGLMQRLAQASLVSGQNVNPNDIMGGLNSYLESMRTQFPDLAGPSAGTQGAGQQSPAASSLATQIGAQAALAPTQNPSPPVAAQTGAPQATQPVAQPAPSAPSSPLAQQRAMFDRWGQFNTLFGDPKDAKSYFDLARSGLTPETGVAIVNGRPVDAISGTPLSGQDIQSRMAGRAGAIATAQEVPHVEGANAINDYSAANQRITDNNRIGGEGRNQIADAQERGRQARLTTDNEKDQTPIQGYSTETGEPTVAPASALKNGGSIPNFAPGTNPYIAQHAAIAKTAGEDSEKAAQGLQSIEILSNAAKGLYTGPAGELVQDMRRIASSLHVGGKEWEDAAVKGDVVRMASLELAAIKARTDTGGSRLPLGTLNAYRQVKASLESKDVAVQARAMSATFQRAVDFNNFVSGYFSQPGNWNKSQADVVTAFRAENPDQKYVDMATPRPSPTGTKLPAGAKLSPGLHVDKNGNKIMVHPDGTYTEQ